MKAMSPMMAKRPHLDPNDHSSYSRHYCRFLLLRLPLNSAHRNVHINDEVRKRMAYARPVSLIDTHSFGFI